VSVEFKTRLASRALRAQFSLNSLEVEKLDAFYQLLVRWNQRINLTALPLVPLVDATLDRFLVEPLAATRSVSSDPLDWIDLGSGGGSPAVPIKIARPAARLTMIEARAKKAAFLREVARELELRDVQVVSTRFEDVQPPSGEAIADLVTVRAVRMDETLFRNAGRFLRSDGRLLLFTNEAVTNRLSHSLFRLVRSEVLLLPGGSHRLAVFERL
jgi:16S rRNA (guanine527-N7)-methyltransferase